MQCHALLVSIIILLLVFLLNDELTEKFLELLFIVFVEMSCKPQRFKCVLSVTMLISSVLLCANIHV